MTARTETLALMQRATQHGITLSFSDANTLRRAQITLHGWGELECGIGGTHHDPLSTWQITRDEHDIPYLESTRYPNFNLVYKRRIQDREKGALKRIQEVCDRNGLHFFHQTDPRGCALYVSKDPMTDNNYSHALACC